MKGKVSLAPKTSILLFFGGQGLKLKGFRLQGLSRVLAKGRRASIFEHTHRQVQAMLGEDSEDPIIIEVEVHPSAEDVWNAIQRRGNHLKLDSLETLDDAELNTVIAHSQELLKVRDEARKAKALKDAKALLVSAGLLLSDLKGEAKTAEIPAVWGRAALPASE